jgi:Transcriptional repressor TCF25
MSARAIRALRGEENLLVPDAAVDDDDTDDDDEMAPRQTVSAFAFIHDESSSSSGEDDEDENISPKDDPDAKVASENDDEVDFGQDREPNVEEKKRLLGVQDGRGEAVTEEEEEDLDALIGEFREKDTLLPRSHLDQDDETAAFDPPSCFAFILDGMDARDLDYEYTIRTSLMSTNASSNNKGSTSSSSSGSRKSSSPLFGPPRDGWPSRPPRLVGGGIGMKYTQLSTTQDRLPWPYSTVIGECATWCSFVHSELCTRDWRDFESIRQTGDFNTMVLFVAHHPYVTPALYQLCTVLYQTNHSAEGLAFLRRVLWIYETSALNSFTQQLCRNGRVPLMDYSKRENKVFFQALFKLVHVSHIAGYVILLTDGGVSL